MPKTLSRKQFIQILALGGGATAAIKFGFDRLNSFAQVSETRLLMGTIVNLTIITDDKVTAQNGLTAALDRMEALESILSQYKSASQLSLLNANGAVQNPDPALVEVLTEAFRLSELSSGAFDITVKPLLDLYKIAEGKPLEEEALADALALVDYSRISISANKISLNKPGMQITVDGIAKGYIVDQAVQTLKIFDLQNVMVEAGGDLMASGGKEQGIPWKVGVQSPRVEINGMLASFRVKNQAVATSGDYMQAYTSDFSQHHILNPRTGLSAPELASATVIATSTMLADALATTLMSLGPENGLALIETLANTETFLVGKDLKVYKSSGFAV